ncbi:hypothetical protein SKAU_G00356130 [Synaphobranchus kaupii]|uniref:Uncharacterized protein n=1 Tax=Synaphobranchus kaupii TaxID=118154 RepID=A0A9Q1EHG2_SYNKA|nr:hypothetical protein SKAU_G00356130 [Synaphobranchus kaupii]
MSRHSPNDNSVTPPKAAVDVCRVCGDDFASKTGKHNLLQGKDSSVRPDYTAALECLTGPVLLGDGRLRILSDAAQAVSQQELPKDGVVSARFQQTCSANVCTPAITHVVVRPGPMRSSKRAPTVADLILQKKKQQVEETKHMKVILKRASGMKCRVLRGPLEKIGQDLVQG